VEQKTLPQAVKDGVQNAANWLFDILPALVMMCATLILGTLIICGTLFVVLTTIRLLVENTK
jgi:hypothetical protein